MMNVESCFLSDTKTEIPKIKSKQFKAIQQAAQELIQKEYQKQAVSTYVEVTELIHEIELELITRQERL